MGGHWPLFGFLHLLHPNSIPFWFILEVWMASTVSHWFIHMVVVYLKFVVICYWIDRRRFMMDVVDHKGQIASMKVSVTEGKRHSFEKQEWKRSKRKGNGKLTNYEFEPLLL